MNELEAIKILHKMCSDLAKCYANTIDKRNALGISIKALEKQSSGGWIPCSDRLPENNNDVIVCDTEGQVFTACYYGDDDWEDTYFNVVDYDVIAWQPLPQPYKE